MPDLNKIDSLCPGTLISKNKRYMYVFGQIDFTDKGLIERIDLKSENPKWQAIDSGLAFGFVNLYHGIQAIFKNDISEEVNIFGA